MRNAASKPSTTSATITITIFAKLYGRRPTTSPVRAFTRIW
jgi:hypothetical protein